MTLETPLLEHKPLTITANEPIIVKQAIPWEASGKWRYFIYFSFA